MKHVLATLIQNTALLPAIMIDLGISRKPVRQDQWRCRAEAGVILGGICFAPTPTPLRLETISVFATQSVLLSVSVLFLAAIPTFFTIVIASLRITRQHPLPLALHVKDGVLAND